jgi:CubicO group peptidase (beta-lactamase class C family)
MTGDVRRSAFDVRRSGSRFAVLVPTLGVLAACTIALAGARIAGAGGQSAPRYVDDVFAKYRSNTPGCTVGVAIDGKRVVIKGYGMADLEHDVPIGEDTIFEAGSVSKQFTATAVLLLAREGKLSLDDPVKKYISELPDFGAPLTIRHILTHTSGLRDWGSVESIAGWPRTSRVYTHAHVLDIVSLQKAPNFTPGTNWSYSNTGFNLAAIIVSRVSGQAFADFTRDRLFTPLGMTHTSWRDDYARIVKGRAMAYAERNGGFRTEMPFENVYGNGGLLTTAGDLLKWNENFVTPKVGDQAFVEEQQRTGQFNDGRPHIYAFGLYVRKYKGVREVSHSGSTAGYRAFLARYPDQHASVAVLCNVASANPTELAHQVADIYVKGLTAAPDTAPTAAQIAAAAGLYRSTVTGETIVIGGGRNALGSRQWRFDRGRATAVDEHGVTEAYEKVARAAPTAQDLPAYAGTYVSDEAETTLVVAVSDGKLVVKRRPDTTVPLTPLYADAFTDRQPGASPQTDDSMRPPLGTIIFRRDNAGRVNALSVVQERVWDLRFVKR